MNGANPSGLGVAKTRPDADRFKGLLPDEEARALRRDLLAGLLDAGFTKEQLAQITGWSPRTIRRDLSGAPAGRPIARRARATPPDLTFDEELAQARHGLTAREARELVAEYGPDSDFARDHPEVGTFLATVTLAAAAG